MTTAEAALTLSAVDFSFDSSDQPDILHSFSLRVGLGESIAIMGASGLGKSTLGMLIGGLLSSKSGDIERHASLASPRDVVYVDQDPLNTLFPWQTARENIAYPLRRLGHSRAQARERADSLLDHFGLLTRAEAFPRALSGGERQRLALARVLGWGPKVIVLDESFSALDARARARALAAVHAAYVESRATLVMITHSVADVLALATRCVVLASRPLEIVADIPIDADFPRTESDPAYLAARERLLGTVRDGLL